MLSNNDIQGIPEGHSASQIAAHLSPTGIIPRLDSNKNKPRELLLDTISKVIQKRENLTHQMGTRESFYATLTTSNVEFTVQKNQQKEIATTTTNKQSTQLLPEFFSRKEFEKLMLSPSLHINFVGVYSKENKAVHGIKGKLEHYESEIIEMLCNATHGLASNEYAQIYLIDNHQYLLIRRMSYDTIAVIEGSTLKQTLGYVVKSLNNFHIATINNTTHTKAAVVQPDVEKTQKSLNRESEQDQTYNAAFRLQSRILPPKAELDQSYPDNTLIYLPKDRISGDFYWYKQFNEHFIIILGDCMGHGIEGAMISTMIVTFLNMNIINEFTKPSAILKDIHNHLILSNSNSSVDIVAISINTKFFMIEYSSSKIDFIRISGNNDIHIQKGSRLSLGINHINLDDIIDTSIQYTRNDKLLLYTDGLVDQFGGPTPKDKKFGKKITAQLASHLQQSDCYSLDAFALSTINEWKGTNEQTDDITLIAFSL
jgi:serine phosphatase RsbU (regulator of sigma subunit)